RMLPIFENALLRPLAKVVIPAVAAKATSARINRYSTSPWPASSLCKRFREFRIRVFMLVFSSEIVCLNSQRRGGRDGHTERPSIGTWGTKASLADCLRRVYLAKPLTLWRRIGLFDRLARHNNPTSG